MEAFLVNKTKEICASIYIKSTQVNSIQKLHNHSEKKLLPPHGFLVQLIEIEDCCLIKF